MVARIPLYLVRAELRLCSVSAIYRMPSHKFLSAWSRRPPGGYRLAVSE